MGTLSSRFPLRLLVATLMGALLFFLVVLMRWGSFESAQSQIQIVAERDRVSVERAFNASIESSFHSLKHLARQLGRDPVLVAGLAAIDRDRLMRVAEPLLTRLQAEHGIGFLSFHLPDRTNLLRVHKPDVSGDRVARFSATRAERTGKPAAALEWGAPETLALRLVRPLYYEGRLAGYAELGKDIAKVLESVGQVSGAEVYLEVDSPAPDHQALVARIADGLRTRRDRPRHSAVLLGNAVNFLALPALAAPKKPPPGWHLFRKLVASVSAPTGRNQTGAYAGGHWYGFAGKDYSRTMLPVSAPGNASLGTLIVFRDVTAQVQQVDRKFNALLVFSLVIGLLVTAAFFWMVGRIERRQALTRQILIDEAAGRDLDKANRIRDLERERERLRNAQRIGRVGNWEWDTGGGMITCSKDSYRMFDMRPDQFDQTLAGFLGLVHPEDKPGVMQQMKALSTATDRWQSEFRIVTPENRQRVVRFKAEPVLDKDGRLLRVRGTVQDITEHREEARTLGLRDTDPDSIVRHIPDAIVVFDAAGKVVYWNPAAERLLRYPADEVLGEDVHRFFLLFNWRDVCRIGSAGFEAGEGNPPAVQNLEVVAIGRGGREFPVELSLSAAEINGRQCAVGVVRDMTRRKAGEEKRNRVSRALGAIHTAGLFYTRDADLTRLLKDACGAMVDLAGYRFAGIGLVEGDDPERMTPSRYTCSDSDWLGMVEGLCDSSPGAHSPVSEVIRTGRSRILSHLEQEPDAAQWRREALRHRCPSIVILPLKRRSRGFGVLVLCPADTDAFTEGDVGMLEELAGVLSYGICAVRGNAPRSTEQAG